jgi:hypothetical protein
MQESVKVARQIDSMLVHQWEFGDEDHFNDEIMIF